MLGTVEPLRTKKKWSLSNLPPKGDEDVGPFFYHLFQLAYDERESKRMTERWMENHRVFRGKHWQNIGMKKDDHRKVTINLFFANVQRTVANITAKEPQAEVVEIKSTDTNFVPAPFTKEDFVKATSRKMKSWYNKTEQGKVLNTSALNMEVYGSTIEKGFWNKAKGETEIIVCDPFAFLPAPGYYKDIPASMPYCVHMTPMRVDEIEKIFDVDGVQTDDVYSILGEDREDNRPIPYGSRAGARNYPSNYTNHRSQNARDRHIRENRALVLELWVRDWSRDAQGVLKYPGGIRVVTITNHGNLVLNDMANPNVNRALPKEQTSRSYLYNHFPFWKADSYEDSQSFWGFSSAEQVADLNIKIDELLSRIANYLGRLMLPTLIVPRDTGITLDMINNKAGLVLQPTNYATSQGIRYVAPPNLPSNFIELLNTYIGLFDRVSQIEDADRGQAPGGVIAASAIVALQERGAVLMRHKIRAIDYLIRQRGRVSLSNYQNFGTKKEEFDIDKEDALVMRGVDLAPFRLDYIVESGSTVHRTEAQIQEQAVALYQQGVIDRQALLEAIRFPDWKAIVERIGEGQLSQAMAILVQAGLPEDVAQELTQYLMEPQGGPGAGGGMPGKAGAPAAPGTPTAQQG